MFLYVSSQGEEEEEGEALCPPKVVATNHNQKHWAGKVEIVSKSI